MFTGIVKAVGTITRVEPCGGDLRLTVSTRQLDWRSYQTGESICVNGICLTAVVLHEDGFDTDVSTETMSVTSLASLSVGDKVNIEPSLALGERLGGHLVSGHIDCAGTVSRMHDDARSLRLEIEVPGDFARYFARKGSVCVDGVSLTINAVSARRIALNIIPHTVENTIIGGYKVGTKVNIEVDLLARYVERLMSKDDNDDGVSMDLLREHGYAK